MRTKTHQDTHLMFSLNHSLTHLLSLITHSVMYSLTCLHLNVLNLNSDLFWEFLLCSLLKTSYNDITYTDTDKHTNTFLERHIFAVHLDITKGCLHKSLFILVLKCAQIYDHGIWLKYVTLSIVVMDTHTCTHAGTHTHTHTHAPTNTHIDTNMYTCSYKQAHTHTHTHTHTYLCT